MPDLLFLKLGGSLITDKTGIEAVRPQVLARLAAEIQQARVARPRLRLLLGHGSGSFGHVTAAQYGTRHGVQTAEQWRGFAEVSATVARLNRLVTEALLDAGVPVLSLQPSASALCDNGRITAMAVAPVQLALEAGLVPLVYGDVAFDTTRGGAIVSTEEIMAYLVSALRPSWLLLAGETAGVLDEARIIPLITTTDFDQVRGVLGGSHGTDVTGGMASKVQAMLDLVAAYPFLAVRIFSGLADGNVVQALQTPDTAPGTLLRQ